MIRTTHKDKWIQYRGEDILLHRGEAIFGTQELGEKTGHTRQQTRLLIKKLKKWKIITTDTKRTSKATIATFCKYGINKESQPTKEPMDNQQGTNGEPMDNQHATTNTDNIYNTNQPEERENFTPPTLPECIEFGKQIGCQEEWTKEFYQFWTDGNWNIAPRTWQQRLRSWRNIQKGQRVGGKSKHAPETLTAEDYE